MSATKSEQLCPLYCDVWHELWVGWFWKAEQYGLYRQGPFSHEWKALAAAERFFKTGEA